MDNKENFSNNLVNNLIDSIIAMLNVDDKTAKELKEKLLKNGVIDIDTTDCSVPVEKFYKAFDKVFDGIFNDETIFSKTPKCSSIFESLINSLSDDKDNEDVSDNVEETAEDLNDEDDDLSCDTCVDCKGCKNCKENIEDYSETEYEFVDEQKSELKNSIDTHATLEEDDTEESLYGSIIQNFYDSQFYREVDNLCDSAVDAFAVDAIADFIANNIKNSIKVKAYENLIENGKFVGIKVIHYYHDNDDFSICPYIEHLETSHESTKTFEEFKKEIALKINTVLGQEFIQTHLNIINVEDEDIEDLPGARYRAELTCIFKDSYQIKA